jgi:hypothetical protein
MQPFLRRRDAGLVSLWNLSVQFLIPRFISSASMHLLALIKTHLVPAVGLEAKADVFAVVHEWDQWFANKGE